MAKNDKKAPKKVYIQLKKEDGKNGDKYLVKGNRFCFQGKKYTAEEAVENEDLVARLVADQSPAIEKV